ncbi:MAG: 7-cyano-7-deazaguanine synthase [Clostridia bacterium]|nr:7-cyano-7-deazaguanine synthase [Clostridia bacterium]
MMTKQCAMLFSGGLDSSFAACKMLEQGYDIELLHFDQGALISNNLSLIRLKELSEAYPKAKINIHNLNTSGLFRKVALTTLESDILKYKISLVCLGCKLAMHIQSIIFCKNNGITVIADGATKRQNRYSEQREIAIEYIKKLYNEYGIEYLNPVYFFEKKEIKYGLFDRGITIQPLEDTCIFSNTFTVASDIVIEQYINEKYNLCKKLIERGLEYEKNR